KVRPPEGSFSWVNTRFLEHIVPHQPNYVVATEGVDVPVFMGSGVVKGRTVVGAKLKRGAQVTSIGPSPTAEASPSIPTAPDPPQATPVHSEPSTPPVAPRPRRPPAARPPSPAAA